MEPKELSPALLQPQVTVVATLGELLDTLHRRDEEAMMLECPGLLHKDLEEFTEELRVTLHDIENTPRRHIVPNDDDGGVTSLSQALAAYGSTPQTTRGSVAMAASEWQWSVSVLVYSWAKLSRKATELCDTWSKVATEAMTTRARELQAEAAHDGTALERMGELGQALGGEEGVEVGTRTESSVRREARVAASEATTATMERERLEPALGLLERLVAACRKATTFPQVLQSVLRDTETTLKGTKKSPDVPEDLVAKVAEAERLWEANAHLAKEHLVGIADDLIRSYSKSGHTSPSACGVPKRCQRAMEDIPRLLRLPERPQDVPEESLVSMELKKAFPLHYA
nr:uncharacterized protein LOC102070686 [Zonotrichia albicollis]